MTGQDGHQSVAELWRGPAAGIHPAVPRFLQQSLGDERLLLIRAPDGMGAQWFAASWASSNTGAFQPEGDEEGPERIISWIPDMEDADILVRRVGSLLAEHPRMSFAVVAGANAPIYELASVFPCRIAGPMDLMLTIDEIGVLCRSYTRMPAGSLSSEPEEIFRLTGGWLVAVYALLASPRGESARRVLAAPLWRWLKARDGLGVMADAAFLPEFTQDILDLFQPVGGQRGPTLPEMISEGLLRADHMGTWFMPELIREAITDIVREAGQDRVDLVVGATVEAITRAGRVDRAIDVAISRRSWPSLWKVLHNKAADLFTSDARFLRAVLSRIPHHIRAQKDYLNVALRILNAAGPDRMVLPLPSVEPDLRNDRTAHRLRERTNRLYRAPDARAVSFGLLEISHLRLAGHYVEAADASIRLRQAVEAAMDARPISFALAGLADLHAGVSLHLADRLPEACLAYTRALHWARGGGHSFVEADALAKLALLSAHQGQTAQTRSWLAELGEPLSRIGWGRRMVSRCADLAQASVALTVLDLEGAGRILQQLPPEPDTDEFWPAHAQLLTMHQAFLGQGSSAAQRLVTWRQARPYASLSPLADRLLTETYHLIRVTAGETSAVPGWEASPELANLEALRCLRIGFADGALRALQSPVRIGQRQQRVAALLSLYASSAAGPGGLDEDSMRGIARMQAVDGELADLAPLYHLGLLPALSRLGLVPEEEAARLSALPQYDPVSDPRPHLTPREKDVLDLLRQGMTRRQIAEATFRSENTIKAQLHSLYTKLGASSVKDALEQARHYGF